MRLYPSGRVLNRPAKTRQLRIEALEPRQLLSGNSAAAAWSFVGSGDIRGNGTTALIWQNQSSGAVGASLTANGTASSWVNLPSANPAVWKAVGVGNFLGTGTSGVLWLNESTGQVGVWGISNAAVTSWVTLGYVDPTAWTPAGVGNFDGNGNTDVLWVNKSTGLVGAWLVNNGAITSWMTLGYADPTVWNVVGLGDFTGAGTTDVLWQNSSTGMVGAWLINSGSVTSWMSLGSAAPGTWQVAGVGNFDNNGIADVLWQNQSDGSFGEWLVQGNSDSWVSLPYADPSQWQLVGVTSMAGDANQEILWENLSTDAVGSWLMQDGNVVGWSSLGTAGSSTSGPTGSADFLGLSDQALAAEVQSVVSASSNVLTRDDMIAIFQYVATENGGVLSATDLGDLNTILNDAATLNMPGYVQVLAGDVVDGNPANADYLGQPLGNLAAGSSATQLNDLVGKWFLGTDLPAADAYGNFSYASFAGDPLFGPNGPSYADLEQGELGDCYFLSSLGSIADAVNPATGAAVGQQDIANMFINNGDGTYTVRFFDNGTADYVTVNTMLPVYGGSPIYDGLGTGNSLWLPLAEKAYAEWNATGNEGRDPAVNDYNSIQGGWMGDVYAQVLGYYGQDYYSLSSKSTLANAVLNSANAVTIGTNNNGGDGLYGDHAYVVLSYNSANGTFQLYNPWGVDEPGPLTWNQLRATCDGFSVIDTMPGPGPISGAPSGSVAAPALIAANTAVSPAAGGWNVALSADSAGSGSANKAALPEEGVLPAGRTLLSEEAPTVKVHYAADLAATIPAPHTAAVPAELATQAVDEVFSSDGWIDAG